MDHGPYLNRLIDFGGAKLTQCRIAPSQDSESLSVYCPFLRSLRIVLSQVLLGTGLIGRIFTSPITLTIVSQF